MMPLSPRNFGIVRREAGEALTRLTNYVFVAYNIVCHSIRSFAFKSKAISHNLYFMRLPSRLTHSESVTGIPARGAASWL
jgi:hypothetical protein